MSTSVMALATTIKDIKKPLDTDKMHKENLAKLKLTPLKCAKTVAIGLPKKAIKAVFKEMAKEVKTVMKGGGGGAPQAGPSGD